MLPKHNKRRVYERESFHARIEMEHEAQNRVEARLKALELLLKNQGRK